MIYFVSYCENDDINFLKTILLKRDLVVGVDQGAGILFENGLNPNYIIGDFDSFNINEKDIHSEIKIIRLNPEKDESDLEYAINYFSDSNHEMTIINSMQGRLDHILTTLFLIDTQKNICILNSKQKIYLINNYLNETLTPGTCVSLLPVSEEVRDISTKGLYYPLNQAVLYRNKSRGLSNKSVDNIVEISFSVGKLLVIIS